MLFVLLHELGHMLAGILLGFKPNSLEIMPVGLSISFEGKVDFYNKRIKKGSLLTLKKLIIAASGPITNIIFIIFFLLFDVSPLGIDRELILYANILIAIFNLIPIYPLDGGRIINGILEIIYGRKEAYEYTNKISNICIAMITAISSIAILYWKNIAILFIITYLWYLVIVENKKYKNKQEIYKRIEKIGQKNEKIII